MPSFGLAEALKGAVEASRAAKVVRPAEAALNDAAADRAFAAKGVAHDVSGLKPAPMDIAAPDVGAPPKVNIPAESVPADVQPGADQPITGTPAATPADAAAGDDAVTATPNQAADASLGGEPAPGSVEASGDVTDTAPQPKTADLAEDEKVPPDSTVKPGELDTPVDEAPAPVPSDVDTYAARLQAANLGDFALDASHQPNFDRMTVTDDVKATIAQVAEDNKGKIDEARRGKITNEQLTGLANDLDTNADVVKAVLTRESGGVLNAETLLAARQVLNSSATRLQALAAKVAAGTATDLEKVQLARQAQFHNDYQTSLMGARAEAGRALNAFNIPTGSDPATISRIAEIVNGNGSNIQKLAQALSMTDDVAGVGQVVSAPGGLFKRTLGAAGNLINRVFVNGILSGPPTWGKIGVANALFQAMNATELAFAARIGRFLPGDEHVMAGEAYATVAGSLGGFSDAFRLAGRALRTQSTLDNVGIGGEALGNAKKDIGYFLPGVDKTAYLGSFIRGIEYTLNIPGSIIGAGDEGYKTIAYRGYATRQAFLHVQDQLATGAITAEQAAQTAKDFLENMPADVQNDAEAYAHQMTFQTPLGPLASKWSDSINSTPAVKLIVPFMRTATNIFKESAMRSPFALFSNKFYATMAEGGAARDLMVTRVAMGTATCALAASLVANDNMTGGGPLEPKARALWSQDGRKPYSVRVVDPISGKTTWATYGNIEPISSVLGAVADATEIASYIHADDDVATMSDSDTQLMQAGGAIIAGVMNNTMKKSFVEGLANFFDFANDPGKNLQRYAMNTTASLVPFSGATRFVRNTQDPYLREAWTTMDAIRNNLPGYSEGLPLTPDVFGEPRLGKSSSPIGLMSPISFSDAKSDPVVAELKTVMEQTRQVPISMPDKRQGGVDGVGGMRLDAGMYSNLVQIARYQPIFSNGNTFKDQLQDTIDSKTYQSSTPLERADLLRKVQTSADKIGVAMLEQQDPAYAQAIAAWRMKANRLKFDQ